MVRCWGAKNAADALGGPCPLEQIGSLDRAWGLRAGLCDAWQPQGAMLEGGLARHGPLTCSGLQPVAWW
jgi:hypothetical protein